MAVLASALVNPLRAQQATSGISYGGPLLDRSTLTGDWGGARDDLTAQGITITPSLTQFYQGPIAGNTNHIFDYGGKAEVFLNIDAEKLGLWDSFAMQVHGEYNFGRTPGMVGGTTIPINTALTFPYQNQPGGDLTSVFFSQRFGSNFTLLAGKINIIDFYSTGAKFNGGRGIGSFENAAFAAPPSGTLPVSLFGAIGSLKVDPLNFSLWVYDPRETLNRTGFEDPFSEGVTVRGSISLSSSLFGLSHKDTLSATLSSEEGTDFTTLPNLGKFLGTAINTTAFRNSLIDALVDEDLYGQDAQTSLPSQLLPSPSQKRGRRYLGYAFEQTLWQSAEDPTNSWGLFGQTAVSEGNPNALKWSVLGGIGGTSPLPGRANDKFGVGFFYYGYSNELKQALDPLITLGDEYGSEFFYDFAVTKWFRLTADAQILAPAIKAQITGGSLTNPTVANNPTVVILGLRGGVRF